MRPRATPPSRTSVDFILKEGVVKRIVRQAKVAEEHRVALACHDNRKELFGYVNKHKPRALLGPVFSSDGHLVTDDEEMAREFINYISNVITVEDVNNIPVPVIVHAGENPLTDIDCAEPEELQTHQPDLRPRKVFEPIIKDRVVNFLEKNYLIITIQHGFHQGGFCVTIVLDFYQYVFCECDRSRAVDVVFLDFRNAFDKVPHKRLKRKVRALGIQGNVAAWIENGNEAEGHR